MTEQIAEKTMMAQSELIRTLQKELEEARRENKKLREELSIAEALLIGNKITMSESKIQRTQHSICQKTYFVPRRIV